MNNRSCALFRAANLRIMDYPFDAALASALSVCDEAVVVVGPSADDTAEWVCELADAYPGRVTVAAMDFVYDRMWQERWWKYAASLTTADWLAFWDADECVHEDDAPILRQMMQDPDAIVIRFEFCHLYGTPRFRKVRNIAKQNARLGRRSHGWRMVNWCTDETPTWPACQMVIGDKDLEAHGVYEGPGIAYAPGYLYHYGHCRDAQALAISNRKHRAWYKDGDGLEDGGIPDVAPWDFRLAHNLANEIAVLFDGQHPAVMGQWFKEHEARWAALEEPCLIPT